MNILRDIFEFKRSPNNVELLNFFMRLYCPKCNVYYKIYKVARLTTNIQKCEITNKDAIMYAIMNNMFLNYIF